MKWTRSGVQLLLQIRAAAASNDWFKNAHNWIVAAMSQNSCA